MAWKDYECLEWALLLLSCQVRSNSFWPHGLQHARLPCPSLTDSWRLLRFMSLESVVLSNHLILCCVFLLLPSVFPSIRVFSIELALRIRWPKYWNFSFSISSSNEYLGLISFRIDCFDLLAVQRTLKSSPAPQFKSINSSALSLLYGPTLTFIQKDVYYMYNRINIVETTVYSIWKLRE